MERAASVAFLLSILGVIAVSLIGRVLSPALGRRTSSRLSLRLLALASLLLPLCVAATKLGVVSPISGLIVIFMIANLAFCVWDARVGYPGISKNLREAADLDGASHFQIFRYVTFPAVRPALLVSFCFSAMTAWSVFGILPLIFPNLDLAPLLYERPVFDLREAIIVSLPLLALFLLLVWRTRSVSPTPWSAGRPLRLGN
ncbi:MAG: ABC transporter permease subunit [Chthoniobacterales bacterium]